MVILGRELTYYEDADVQVQIFTGDRSGLLDIRESAYDLIIEDLWLTLRLEELWS